MKIINRDELDVQRWDDLVNRSGGLVFSLSAYLDSVSKNWCVLTDDAYSKGIALPFAKRLKQRTLYTPIFLRYLEWLGESPTEEALKLIRTSFEAADFSIRGQIKLSNFDEYVYQCILPNQRNSVNDQTKRMLKRFDKSGLNIELTENSEQIINIISEELPAKVDSVNKRSLPGLIKLIDEFQKNKLIEMYVVSNGDENLGGAIFIRHNDRVIYLKSAFRDHAKRSGAMYKIMDMVIVKTLNEGKCFDFGGSRVHGVRRFNLNLGGKDEVYYHYKWNEYPLWFKAIRNLKVRIQK